MADCNLPNLPTDRNIYNILTQLYTKDSYYIYILYLEDNHFYIGQSKNPLFRIGEHFNGYCTEWTNKYNPIDIISIEPVWEMKPYELEELRTIQLMKEYSIAKVRGAYLIHADLSDRYINSAQERIKKLSYPLPNYFTKRINNIEQEMISNE